MNSGGLFLGWEKRGKQKEEKRCESTSQTMVMIQFGACVVCGG